MASASNGWTSATFFVHLLDEFAVARGGPGEWCAVRAGESFAGVVGDLPAHVVAEQRGVLGFSWWPPACKALYQLQA